MAYFIFFFWLLGFFFLWHIPRLKPTPHPGNPASGVSVIIPARNEEKILASLLESLNHQDIESIEILVVDDQSQDATTEIAKKLGVRVIRSSTPPEGWVGKPWACWQGAKAASHEILLFLDADVVLAPGATSRLLTTFMDGEGLLTVQPYHLMQKNYERLSAIFNIIVLAGMNAFTPLQSKLKPAGAFGPCMMCRKDVYFEIGGHKIASNAVLESLPMGHAFIKAGQTVRCFGGRGSVMFRMYPEGLRQLVEGFSKGFATGANAISFSIMAMLVCWIFGGVSLTRHLIQALIFGNETAAMGWLMLDFLYAAQIHWMLTRIGNFGLRTAIFFQIPLVFFVLIFTLSLIKTTVIGRSRWKGRVINAPKGGPPSSCD
jgi:4,4'-diaponeurosporenoate glycosyltransferase